MSPAALNQHQSSPDGPRKEPTIGPLSGDVFVVTHGKITGHTPDGRERIEASRKYVVTDQFEALVSQRAGGSSRKERDTRCG